ASQHLILSTDWNVWNLAHDIRDHYRSENTNEDLPTLTVPDAVHLATAIIYDADCFHTYDRNNVTISEAKQNNWHPKRGLIPLSGNVMGYDLMICAPNIDQVSLLFPEHN
ncbi:MAG: PIN domain-containing protein, partial [Calditrichota bacterium]